MTERDSFGGAWHVTEYVFDSEGVFLASLRQIRRVLVLAPGRLEVQMRCLPCPALAGHPMAAFEGEWRFGLTRQGQKRVYGGPDVTGEGIEWLPGLLTASGRWPHFGPFAFCSWSLLTSPNRQLTGGTFYLGDQMVARIVGVATPAQAADQWPSLPPPVVPGDRARVWTGARLRCQLGLEAPREATATVRLLPGQAWKPGETTIAPLPSHGWARGLEPDPAGQRTRPGADGLAVLDSMTDILYVLQPFIDPVSGMNATPGLDFYRLTPQQEVLNGLV